MSSDVISEALKIPQGGSTSADLYAAAAAALAGKAPGAPSPFKDVASYPVEYHCQRFIMGNTMDFDGEGRKVSTPTDDEAKLAEIMQMKWEGKALISNRLDTFLQDGTVVVWLEWLTPKEAKAEPRPPHARTVGELLDPRVPPASEGAVPPEAKGPMGKSAQGVDALSPVGDEDFLGEHGDSFEDDADF